jgi:hypothetical protein
MSYYALLIPGTGATQEYPTEFDLPGTTRLEALGAQLASSSKRAVASSVWTRIGDGLANPGTTTVTIRVAAISEDTAWLRVLEIAAKAERAVAVLRYNTENTVQRVYKRDVLGLQDWKATPVGNSSRVWDVTLIFLNASANWTDLSNRDNELVWDDGEPIIGHDGEPILW